MKKCSAGAALSSKFHRAADEPGFYVVTQVTVPTREGWRSAHRLDYSICPPVLPWAESCPLTWKVWTDRRLHPEAVRW